jgi:hypothetical protein
MTTSISEMPEVTDRLDRLEGEMSEVRHALSNLAEIVAGDIKERRQAATEAILTDTPIPASLVPGGKTTVAAVNALRRPWLVTELLGEIGTMVRMYLHPRYRVRRATQMTVLLLLGLVLANHLLLGFVFHMPVASDILQCLIDLVLAVLLYKALSREVGRFRLVLAQLSTPGRTWSATPASLLHNDPDLAVVTREESP